MKNKGIDRLEKHLVPMFADAIEKKIFSAATAAVFFKENNSRKKRIFAFGRTRNDEKGEPVDEETYFDLASLTKPLCTVLCILSLIEKGMLDWHSHVISLKTNRKNPVLGEVTLEHLMSHSAGLRDYRPFFMDFEAVYLPEKKQSILEKVRNEPLVNLPGEKCVYSDLGYMLLGELIERKTGKRLDQYFSETITRPLQLDKAIFFRPLWEESGMEKKKIAATEQCPWRKRLLQGEVHDEHSWLMGGVAGHAGLFGTAAGVLSLAENILELWQGKNNHPAYSFRKIQKTLGWSKEEGTWSLGFDRPSATGSSAGNMFSRKSVGHLGYTGTSFWIDPEKEVIAVLLTNRVYPTRKNDRLKAFRPLFHDTLINAIQ